MLEFIVLGQIPGTRWRLSFTVVLLLWLAVVVGAKSMISYYRYHKLMEAVEQTALYFAVVNMKPARRRRKQA